VVREPEHHKIRISRTAHLYTLGSLTPKTRFVWLVCHGYGQLAERFVKKFTVLDLDRHFIIAPEGLSRFYWGGVSGEVVASWMTRKDPLEEIEDHTHFLDDVYCQYDNLASDDVRWVMFGFSQGNATIIRYLERYRPAFDSLLIWAGRLPRESGNVDFVNYLNQRSLHYFYGDRDIYVTEARLLEEREFFDGINLDIQVHPFHGEHRVDKNTLEAWSGNHFV